jgi:hypothetical protein
MGPDGMAEKELKGFAKPPGRAAKLLPRYFLQLPYRYAIPLLGFSAAMHCIGSSPRVYS